MEGNFAWASYCCCRNGEGENDVENDNEAGGTCSTCGVQKNKMAKLESIIRKLKKQMKKLTQERNYLKTENDEFKLENDEFAQVIHELELENTQIQSKFEISEEKRKTEKMKLFYSFMMHAMALYRNRSDTLQPIMGHTMRHDRGDIAAQWMLLSDPLMNGVDDHKYESAIAPIPGSAPMAMRRLALERRDSQHRIHELESQVLNLRRQSSLLNQQVGEFKRRESKVSRQRLSLLGFIPLAPPLLGVSYMPSKLEIKPSVAMKTLHWKHIPDQRIKNTIWEEISKIEEDITSKDIGIEQQEKQDNTLYLDNLFDHLSYHDHNPLVQQFKAFLMDNEYDSDALQYDVTDFMHGSNIYEQNETFVAWIKEFGRKQDEKIGLLDLEQLFPQQAKMKKKDRKKKSRKALVQIIDSKRARNVAIVLGGLKMKISFIKQAILRMDEHIVHSELLAQLIELVPTPEEITKVQSYRGKVRHLPECERFFLAFANMEHVKERLEVWQFKREFEETYHHRMNNVLAMSFMAETIRNSRHFKIVLASLLACGNFINGATKKGGKHGFELKTLQKIATYRSTDNSMSILGYLYKYLRHNYNESLLWIEEFEDLTEVVRIESDQLDSDISCMSNELHKLNGMLSNESNESKDELNNDRFEEAMHAFYSETVQKVLDLEQGWADCVSDILDLSQYFAEKVKSAKKFKPEEFFAIFNDFRNEFIENRNKIVAMEEKRERKETREQKRLKRLKELKKLKQSQAQIQKRRRMRFRKRKRKIDIYSDNISAGISGVDADLESDAYASNVDNHNNDHDDDDDDDDDDDVVDNLLLSYFK